MLATAFELPLQSIEAESERVRRRYGICYADGRIRIRLHQLRADELLKYSVMVDTLCHELAHLRHFDHGRRFWRLYRRILRVRAAPRDLPAGARARCAAADPVPGAAGGDHPRGSAAAPAAPVRRRQVQLELF